jgi:hypothetical protein
LEEHTKVAEEMEIEFVAVCALTIVKNPAADCASILEEIKGEMFFFFNFFKVVHCYDMSFSILRQTRTIFTVEEIAALQSAINEI